MAVLLYIHGFLSSPSSYKACLVQDWLQQCRRDIQFECPELPPYPAQAAAILEAIIQANGQHKLYLIGSSLGGYWATWFTEKYDLPAVLINPATDPYLLEPDYINVPIKNYHSQESYLLTQQHLQELVSFNTPEIKRKKNYWLLVQTGDETLDYRLAVTKYKGCKQTVEEGGDHAFQGTERYLPDMIDFLESN